MFGFYGGRSLQKKSGKFAFFYHEASPCGAAIRGPKLAQIRASDPATGAGSMPRAPCRRPVASLRRESAKAAIWGVVIAVFYDWRGAAEVSAFYISNALSAAVSEENTEINVQGASGRLMSWSCRNRSGASAANGPAMKKAAADPAPLTYGLAAAGPATSRTSSTWKPRNSSSTCAFRVKI